MVNLRGALRGLGEGLTMIGQQGIAEQNRVAADARLMERERAMASINQTIRNQDADTAVKRGLAEYDAQTPLVAGRQQKTLAVQEPFQEAASNRQATREEARDARVAARQEAADIRRDAAADARALAADERRIAAEDRRAGRQPVDTFTGEDGFRHYRYADGTETVGTVRVRDNSSDDFGVTPTPAPAATPASGRDTLTPRPTARRIRFDANGRRIEG